ncbi:Superoxide dismutase [Cu-Zn] [Nesidiocoris tenuis]|uniref:Superoxide dismutase [Cu-Zn] n=1 Tax=Nesidiocoris tenuis TaxID=355587 RepID=A0ABN7B237_9HEMI|nr:Superoxide dismutase [Cu-Zn] [Nesidiocoris tenuis]
MAVRPDPGLRAIALIEGEKVKGKIIFEQFRANQPLKISGEVTGLTHGEHGMHIHEFGDLTSGCSSAGAHLNPHNKQHGGREDEDRHLGDLGNIVANAQGVAKFNMEDKLMSLYGVHSILGRSLVVHADRDDLGKNRMDEKSRTTGNSGQRVGCSVIALAQPEGWDKV